MGNYAVDDEVCAGHERLAPEADRRVVEHPQAFGLVGMDCDDGVHCDCFASPSAARRNSQADPANNNARAIGLAGSPSLPMMPTPRLSQTRIMGPRVMPVPGTPSTKEFESRTPSPDLS